MYARCDWVDLDWHNSRCHREATNLIVNGCLEHHIYEILLCLTHTNAWETAAHNDSVYCEHQNCELNIIGWEKTTIGRADQWLKHHHT